MPHHTRGSMGSRSRLYTEKYVASPDDFLLSDNGLWLLPEVVAERDRKGGIRRLGKIAADQKEAEMFATFEETSWAINVLGHSEVTDTGCIVDGLEPGDRMTTAEFMIYLAGHDRGTVALDAAEDIPHLRACDTPACYNTRHYDLDFAKRTVPRRMTELNPLWYKIGEDGKVKTIWGDTLADIEDSMRLFIKMQKSNFPFVPIEESVLTPSGVAHVSFHPLTGCWETWTYNVKPDGSKGGRFEGYGNLYSRLAPETVDPETGEITRAKRRGNWTAHRTMWKVMGNQIDPSKVLNHLCNYKRCCNPLHLEQITEYDNRIHGQHARKYIRAIEAADPEARDHHLDAATVAKLYEPARALYASLD